MNISEACDVNTVLSYFLGLQGPQERVKEAHAKEAAVKLAKRANAALNAGISGDRVEKSWGKPRRICVACSKVISRGEKFKRGHHGSVMHRNCNDPTAYANGLKHPKAKVAT